MRDGLVGALIFAVGGLFGWVASSAFDDSATSSDVGAIADEVDAIADEVGAIKGQVGAIADEVGGIKGQVGAIADEVAAINGQVGSIGAAVAATDREATPDETIGLPYVTLACGSEEDTRTVETFLVDVDPDEVPILLVLAAGDEPSFEAVELGDEVPLGADLYWRLRDGNPSPSVIEDVNDRCGDVEPAAPPSASVTLGCGSEPGSLVIEAFEPDIDPAQTALLFSWDSSGRLDQLEIGDVVPPDGELQWSISGITRGPWPVDGIVEACSG